MKRLLNILITTAVALSVASCGNEDDPYDNIKKIRIEDLTQQESAGASEDDEATCIYGIQADLYDVLDGEVDSGESFSTLLDNLGVGQQDVGEMVELSKDVFDVRKLRAGNDYHAFFEKSGDSTRLAYLVYEKDNVNAVIYHFSDSLYVKLFSKEVENVLRYAEVTIENSLWGDVAAAGFSPLLAVGLSDIYAWTIDFFALQKGDSFKALYYEKMCDGKVMDVGEVLYADFVHSGKDYYCYRFEEEGVSNKYWNEKGESLRKSFLKAPLQYFSRISSKFSFARRHPITRVVRPHTGVDYAAPVGTPVMAIGDGVVIDKGYRGAGGNTVKIKHNSSYTSAYLHLSRFGKGVANGSHVRQGQVIGYVGSTGRSTGPHLDFRIWKDGKPVDPLKMVSPPAEPVRDADMPAFEQRKERYSAMLDSLRFDELYGRYVLSPLGLSK